MKKYRLLVLCAGFAYLPATFAQEKPHTQKTTCRGSLMRLSAVDLEPKSKKIIHHHNIEAQPNIGSFIHSGLSWIKCTHKLSQSLKKLHTYPTDGFLAWSFEDKDNQIFRSGKVDLKGFEYGGPLDDVFDGDTRIIVKEDNYAMANVYITDADIKKPKPKRRKLPVASWHTPFTLAVLVPLIHIDGNPVAPKESAAFYVQEFLNMYVVNLFIKRDLLASSLKAAVFLDVEPGGKFEDAFWLQADMNTVEDIINAQTHK